MLIGNNNVIKYLNATAPSVLVNASVDDYLFFYGCGGGSSQTMSGTGNSNNFVEYKPKVFINNINVIVCLMVFEVRVDNVVWKLFWGF